MASIRETVLAPSCARSGCHAALDPAAGLDLASDGLEARLVEAPAATCDRVLVVPRDPEASFFYEKIVATTPACGARMPLDGGPLDASATACIRSWIDSLPVDCERCGGPLCVDLTTDRAHCGDCTTACPAGASCVDGTCGCPGGTSSCGDTCADTSSDPAHCGDCNTTCSPQLVCSLGACKQGCDSGLVDCAGSCVDTSTSASHCGSCDHDCGVGGTCAAGSCSCAGGADPLVDPYNCGTCGHACAPGQSCEAGECACAGTSVSFSADVAPIFVAHCATNGCHTGASPKEGLDLGSGAAWDSLVGIAAGECSDGRYRVEPGDPSRSYLIDKILGVDLCSGTKMPKLSSLTTAQSTAISNWICGGALDD